MIVEARETTIETEPNAVGVTYTPLRFRFVRRRNGYAEPIIEIDKIITSASGQREHRAYELIARLTPQDTKALAALLVVELLTPEGVAVVRAPIGGGG